MPSSQVRIYAILARDRPFAAVFRRGPSKNVLLLGWNTLNDTFQPGQWLKGRIYERRCDLSPKGDLLVYCAANNRAPIYSWSAISRPPFLTALAMWPKNDAWGGGGRFVSRTRMELNHHDSELKLAQGFSVPKWLKVTQFGERPGRGEDDPIYSERLKRDGWKLVDFPTETKDDFNAKMWMKFSPPIKWMKPNRKWPRYSLEMSILGIKEKNGPWYVTEHSLRDEQESRLDNIGRSDWADWSQSGDLLFARDGCLYRVPCKAGILARLQDAVEIADFSGMRFQPVKAPPEYLRWPAR
jgi:hypothetical protein